MISCIVVDEPGLMAYKNKGTNIKIIFLLFFKKKIQFFIQTNYKKFMENYSHFC
jgi:hypothetical protein